MIQPLKQVKWQGLILDQETSGQGIAAFCRAREVSESLFYYWRKKLREVASPGFVEVQVAEPQSRDHDRAVQFAHAGPGASVAHLVSGRGDRYALRI